jgi:DNA polymerase-3 subunit gamma/tau
MTLKKPDYQVIARRFRPQSFKDVVGQDAIVTTLKNAIKHKRLAQAYLFCGSRGTGKTTLARLLAKALNCQHPSDEMEPCNECSSCREITSGHSLDVMEIDGASHRGIEDIRQINDTVGYAAASGHYKIYIIDEVHMLTKEAFNALLKTLEEPPPKVKFFFATTEPHKVLATILSRCQRFNLTRIPLTEIIAKLSRIAQELGVDADTEALHLLALRADGGLRDAESLFDQILAFEEGRITLESVSSILGLPPREIYFELDRAGKAGVFSKAFDIAQRLFSEGKDLSYFIDGLIDHLRQILLIRLSSKEYAALPLTKAEREQYEQSAHLYSDEQCIELIEYLLQAQQQLRTSSFGKISLESILLHVMRSHFRIPLELLVRRLSALEAAFSDPSMAAAPSSSPPMPAVATPQPVQPAPTKQAELVQPQQQPRQPALVPEPIQRNTPPPPAEPVKQQSEALPQPIDPFVCIDPTPKATDIRTTDKKAAKPTPPPANKPEPAKNDEQEQKGKRPIHEYDTLFHFAAIELEGKLKKTGFTR